ncbi:MAG: beta-mannosidase [Spirochaetales bacterium]
MNVLSLDGTWTATQIDGGVTVSGTVPGCIHTDLLDAGEISDPFYRTREFDAYWVAESEWEYARSFEVSEEMVSADRVLLVCEGLDTLATVSVNGTEIARTDNMFRRYEFDLSQVLVAGENTIAIRFAGALTYTIERQAERHLPGWNHGEKVGRHGYIRKEQCNFGWDWGIRTVTCGIWRSISVVAFSGGRISDVRIDQDHTSGTSVDLHVRTTVESVAGGQSSLAVQVSKDGVVVAKQEVAVNDAEVQATLTIAEPDLWWPNTMGEQPLYEVAVTLRDSSGDELDSRSKRVGLRTLELDRHEDEWGESFQFVVNGIPFFAKGANWIPADAYNNRTTPERYRDLVKSAAAANMNMLRVWGGGLYEEDVFYDLCDEFGICLWQDFMFACFTYPVWDSDFMATVEKEVVDNVKRLRHHPSLALWCGNNELEQGLVGPEWTETTMSWSDYGRLFDKMIPELVAEHDGSTPYWPGSPHTPCGARENFNDPRSGDAHLWSVWHGKEPFEWYRTCEHRFNSEFGFQSFPEPKTTYGYTIPEDRNVTSYVMEHHQRSGIGNSTIMHYMLDWFRLPTGFDQALWTSQILQGMAIKYAVEHWRRSMPRGMGTIYWQLNDTWPVASWSSIDYHHRWKALHYMARKFFAPVLLSGLEDTKTHTVAVHLTSDEQQKRSLTLRWIITDASGAEIASGEKAVTTEANANAHVHTLDLAKLVDQKTERDLIVWLEAYEGSERIAENLVTFARPKHLELSHSPGISSNVSAGADGRFAVTLRADNVALWTWIELEKTDLRATDNFVHLRPDTPRSITVTPSRELSLSDLESQLRVRSLIDLSR